MEARSFPMAQDLIDIVYEGMLNEHRLVAATAPARVAPNDRGLYTKVPAGIIVLVRAGDAGTSPDRLTATAPAADPPRDADMPARGC